VPLGPVTDFYVTEALNTFDASMPSNSPSLHIIKPQARTTRSPGAVEGPPSTLDPMSCPDATFAHAAEAL
jgi:hypothetical protein